MLEDEIHMIYTCKAHRCIQENYKNIVNLNNKDIKTLLGHCAKKVGRVRQQKELKKWKN